MKQKKIFIYTIVSTLCILGLCISYYVLFPPINLHSPVFWIYAMISSCLIACCFYFVGMIYRIKDTVSRNTFRTFSSKNPIVLLGFAIAILSFFALMLGEFFSSPLFHAKTYASLLQVDVCDFTTDIEETENVTNIALMDTHSARIFGDRKIGSLSDVVSQYEVERDYTQINMSGTPMKVASLKYASFFKAWNNKKNGVPGYVKVNPVNSNAEYIKLKQGMKYVPSAYFNYNLKRHVQFAYPTKIVNNYYFEVDDSGNPYYVCPTVTAKIGLFGGMDVEGAILCNPISGACEYFPVSEIPSWIDCVYDGSLLEQKFNWYASLSNGFWNSVISQTGCKQTTDDYGYKTLGDDVWIYTGVTSVNGDESNVGFVMMNQRTSEARYYNISGAEEYSAMSAAEGEVQEKGYAASFPSLINVCGQPTYIMVLKDNGGLVKMYAMVNVEQYNLVATATTQEDVFANYKKLLFSQGDTTIKGTTQSKEITIADVQFIVNDNTTTVYIKDENNIVYKQAFADNEDLIKLSVGQVVKVEYEAMENNIHYLSHFEIVR